MKITLTNAHRVPQSAGGVGLFIEDINYAIDGGLYAELLENRNFEAKNVTGERDKFTVTDDGGYAWSPYPDAASAALKIKTDRPLYAENPHYMRLVANCAGAGMKNKAYDGVYLTKGERYKLSLYVRSYDYRGAVILSVSGGFEKKFKPKADGKWHRYAFRVKAKQDVERGEFRVVLTAGGMLHMDAFSLMPERAVLGVFRRDLVELMQGVRPGFLRFPGGCVVEGNTLQNRYLWKESVGQTERRRQNWNRWAVHGATKETGFQTPFSHYGQTLGVGFYEYFRLAEYLGAKPLPVVSAGIACQYMSSEFVPLDDPEWETYIQDALDLIEFANGGADTMWGKLRAELGHPNPFRLEYLGVGNEQWEDSPKQADGTARSNEFRKRFETFERRIHERYPEIKLVGTVGPAVGTPTHESAWAWTRAKLQENENFVYCSDEHFYVSPEWLYDHVGMYDTYPRGGRVMAGEYAAHIKDMPCAPEDAPRANCWESALAEAAFMTGMERNCDVVVMKSYAPLLGRIGYTQWRPDLIWFDGKSAYGSANYYVQQLYSLYTGDFALGAECDEKGCYVSATEQGGVTIVKAVNASKEEKEADVEADFPLGALTRIIRMEGDLGDYNSFDEPCKIVPFEVAPTSSARALLPPRSFNILIFRK